MRVLAALSAVMLSATAAFAETQTIPTFLTGARATVLSITGYDTENARLVARVTRRDAETWCRRLPDMPSCVSRVLEDNAEPFVVIADCLEGFTRKNDGPVWRIVDGRVVDANVPPVGNARIVQAHVLEQFRALCSE